MLSQNHKNHHSVCRALHLIKAFLKSISLQQNALRQLELLTTATTTPDLTEWGDDARKNYLQHSGGTIRWQPPSLASGMQVRGTDGQPHESSDHWSLLCWRTMVSMHCDCWCWKVMCPVDPLLHSDHHQQRSRVENCQPQNVDILLVHGQRLQYHMHQEINISRAQCFFNTAK